MTSQQFEQEVLKSEIPVLVDFYADWCGPCKMIAPIIEELKKEFDGKIEVSKVNIDESMELAMTFKVVSIPTILIFKEGKVVETLVGFRSKNEFKEIIEKL